MKRRDKILLTLVLLLGIGCAFIPKIINSAIPNVQVTQIKQADYMNYIGASGVIEERNKLQIKTQFPMIVSEVLINIGDTVKKGQPVVKVDRDLTAKKIMETASFATMAGGSTSEIMATYQDAYSKIPSQIVSNVDGVVESISVSSGDFVEQDGVVASMLSGEDLIVNVQIPENKISKVAVGQEVHISGDGFEDNKYLGVVQSISPTARKAFIGTVQETVVDAIIKINNPDDKIKSGYSARAKIFVEEPREMSVVPYETLLQDADGQEYVYVFENGKAIRRNIKTGIELSEGAEVVSGLNKNDYVIVNTDVIKKSGMLVKTGN